MGKAKKASPPVASLWAHYEGSEEDAAGLADQMGEPAQVFTDGPTRPRPVSALERLSVLCELRRAAFLREAGGIDWDEAYHALRGSVYALTSDELVALIKCAETLLESEDDKRRWGGGGIGPEDL